MILNVFIVRLKVYSSVAKKKKKNDDWISIYFLPKHILIS